MSSDVDSGCSVPIPLALTDQMANRHDKHGRRHTRKIHADQTSIKSNKIKVKVCVHCNINLNRYSPLLSPVIESKKK
jgi:hypothetical protein